MRFARLSQQLVFLSVVPVMSCTTVIGPSDDDAVFTGFLERQIFDLPGRPFAVRVAPNGTLYVTQQDLAQVTMLPAGGAADRDSAEVGTDPGDIVVTPDGELVIVSTFIDGDLHFLNAVTGAQTDFTEIGGNAYRLLLSSSGNDLFVTTTEGKVHRVSVASGSKVDSVTLAGPIQGIARGPGGVLAVSSPDGTITLLNPATLDVIDSRVIGGKPQDIAYSGDGERLFIAQEDGAQVLVLDATTLVSVDSIRFGLSVPLRPFGLALSPDGASLVVASAQPGGFALVDARSLDVVQKLWLAGVPRRVAFAPTGLRAFIANEWGHVDVIR